MTYPYFYPAEYTNLKCTNVLLFPSFATIKNIGQPS
jgi:hypothetical protein